MKNNRIFYEEYRQNIRLMQTDGEGVLGGDEKVMISVAKELSRLAHTARDEGLLALKEAVKSVGVSALPLRNELAKIVTLAIDGTDAEILEDIGWKRYFSRGYRGTNGTIYLMYLDTVLEIQVGMPPGVIDENIKALLPREAEEEIESYFSEKSVGDATKGKDGWEGLFRRGNCSVENENFADAVRLINKCLVSMGSADVQRLVKEVGTDDFSIYLKVMDGDATRKLYDNLSWPMREEMYEHFQFLESAQQADIEDAAGRILKTIRRLEDEGEIHIIEGEM